MKIRVECRYCGHIDVIAIYSESAIPKCCSKCQDRDIKVKELAKTNIDYYQGSPPFKGDKPFLYGENND